MASESNLKKQQAAILAAFDFDYAQQIRQAYDWRAFVGVIDGALKREAKRILVKACEQQTTLHEDGWLVTWDDGKLGLAYVDKFYFTDGSTPSSKATRQAAETVRVSTPKIASSRKRTAPVLPPEPETPDADDAPLITFDAPIKETPVVKTARKTKAPATPVKITAKPVVKLVSVAAKKPSKARVKEALKLGTHTKGAESLGITPYAFKKYATEYLFI